MVTNWTGADKKLVVPMEMLRTETKDGDYCSEVSFSELGTDSGSESDHHSSTLKHACKVRKLKNLTKQDYV